MISPTAFRGTITPGIPSAPVGTIGLHLREPVTIGRHRAKLHAAIAFDGMQINAVEVISRFFGRNGKTRLLEQALQLAAFHREPTGHLGLAHVRKVIGGQNRKLETCASGGDFQPAFAAFPFDLDLRPFRELSDDVMERMRRDRHSASGLDLRRDAFNGLHVEISRFQRKATAAIGANQDIRENRDGITAFDNPRDMPESTEQRIPVNNKAHMDNYPAWAVF